MRVGGITIEPLIDGEVSSDAGDLYVDKTLADWKSEGHDRFLDSCTHSYANTIGGFLVRSGERVVVVDTGIGSKPIYPFLGGGFRSSLLATGVRPEDVTDVIFTHLHLDHIGWATQNGCAFFPNGTYRVDRRDWDYFTADDYPMPEWERMLSDPKTDSARNRLAPIENQLEFFEGEEALLPGIRALEASGHTPGSTVLLIESSSDAGLLLGDLVHSEAELCCDDWDFINHVDHDRAMAAVANIRSLILDRSLPFAAAHFTGLRWGRLNRDNGRTDYHVLPI
jgi:glyoxylase-like metal-dependent hydrolase (beta-lactamase superfamily II)